MLKKTIIFILLILGLVYITPSSNDATPDNAKSNKKTSKTKKNDLGIKFRGEVYVGIAYMPEYHDGIMPPNRFGPVTTKGIDYSDAGDPDNEYHTGEGRIVGGTTGALLVGLFTKYSFIFPFLYADSIPVSPMCLA